MMKFPLGSLAVLLLALCRSSSGERLSWGYVTSPGDYKRNDSIFPMHPEVHWEQAEQIVLGIAKNMSDFQFFGLYQHFGNSFYALALNRFGLYETLPAYYKSALDNGILCEMPIVAHDITIISIQYHADELTKEQRAREVEAAKHPSIGFDCDLPYSRDRDGTDACFCMSKPNVLLYCAAIALKIRILKAGVTKKTCEPDIIEMAFKHKPKSMEQIGTDYFVDSFINRFIQIFDKPREEGKMQNIGLDFPPSRYCMTVDPEAHATVRTLFASNALRWTLEGYPMHSVFNGTHKDLDSACAVENFASSDVGKCACTKDTGISFCVHKARAEYYKKIGYLNCTGDTMEFVNKTVTHPPFACHSDSVAAATSAECAEYRKSWL